MTTFPYDTTTDRKRGHRFAPPKTTAAKIPALYTTDQTPTADKIAHLHYFVGGADWYIVELDPDTSIAFGWAEVLPGCGEWGYIDLRELADVVAQGWFRVERDLHWEPTPVSEIERIK